jgi:hypothetical protein
MPRSTRPPNESKNESKHFTLRPKEKATESHTHLALGDDRTLLDPYARLDGGGKSEIFLAKYGQKYTKHLP